jgi:hypothetical protein
VELKDLITPFKHVPGADAQIIATDMLAEAAKQVLPEGSSFVLITVTPTGEGSNVTFRTNIEPRSQIPTLLEAVRTNLQDVGN